MSRIQLFVALCLCAGNAVSGQKVLQIHSFDKEIDHPTFLSRWWNAGASIPLENHIVLSPSVADRYGAQWHKYPLLTNDFEATFTVVVRGSPPATPPPNEQGLAFWYVYENVTSAMPEELTNQATDVTVRMAARGWGLFGYRNQFKGIGVIFSNARQGSTPGTTEFKPSVSVLINDGTRAVQLPADIPTPYGSYWNYRNTPLQVRVRVQKRSVVVEAKAETGKNWVKLADLGADKLPMDITAGGYIGFTAAVGADKPGAPATAFGQHDTVLIDNLVLTNMDPKQAGEEVVTPAPNQKGSELHSQFLHDKSEEGVERAEGKAIKKFSAILFKFISETEPQKKAMMAAISSLSAKLMTMERSVKKLKEEIVTLSGHDMDADFEKMKAELAELSSKAYSDVAVKKQQFDSLKSEIETSLDAKVAAKRASTAQVVRTLHEVDAKARDLKNQVASRGSFTVYVAIFCLLIVLVAGFALQAKLKRWEKKHLL